MLKEKTAEFEKAGKTAKEIEELGASCNDFKDFSYVFAFCSCGFPSSQWFNYSALHGVLSENVSGGVFIPAIFLFGALRLTAPYVYGCTSGGSAFPLVEPVIIFTCKVNGENNVPIDVDKR